MGAEATDGFSRRVEVRIDRDLWERFKVMCDELGVTMSESVRLAIDDLYNRYERGEL